LEKEITKGTRPLVAVGTKKLLSSLPLLELPRHVKPTVVFVIGKPGTGITSILTFGNKIDKTEISKKIAEFLGCAHFNIPTLLQSILNKKDKNQALWNYLLAGNIFDEVIIMDILEQLTHTEEIRFKGFVLQGFPVTPYQVTEIYNWAPIFYPDYVINMDAFDNEDLISRFQGGSGVDCITGNKASKFSHS
jgi:adenylate kinase family enzyme